MTRGRPPRQAIREGMVIAEKLGVVIEGSSLKGSSVDLTIFCTHMTIFVGIRRTRIHINSILDIADKYRDYLLSLRAIPLTDVTLRELWVRSPNASWQYFRILDDGIIEIHNSGSFDRASTDFGKSSIPPDSSTAFAQNPERAPASPYEAGFTCPFFEYMRGRLSP